MSRRDKFFEPGSLVKHWLYEDWLGMVIANAVQSKKTKIYMIPGTRFEFFFRGRVQHQALGRMGWLPNNWLFSANKDWSFFVDKSK
jgi:hypothetical protein